MLVEVESVGTRSTPCTLPRDCLALEKREASEPPAPVPTPKPSIREAV